MAVAAARRNEDRSLVQLLQEFVTEAVSLLRQEIDLAKTEISEKVSHVGTHARTLAIGGGLTFAGGLALLAALILGLTSLLSQVMSGGVAMWLAPLLVALVLGGVGYPMIRKALDTMKTESLVPRKTTKSLQEDKEWLKSKIR